MALVKYDPIRELSSIARRFDDLFNEFKPMFESGSGSHMQPAFAPRVDISEDEQNIYVEAELPGIRKEDVRISVSEGNLLTIRGEKRYERRSGEEPRNGPSGNGNGGYRNGRNGSSRRSNGTSESELVQVEDQQLTQGGNRSYFRIERNYGSFSRSFTLPENADPERISAKFTDGVLEIRIPKKEPSRPKEVSIDIE